MDGGNNEVVIDVVAKLRDKMSRDIKQTEQNVSKLDETMKRTQKNTEKFGSMRVRPSIDVNDKATQKIHRAISSGQSFARRAFSATLSATDKATKTVDLIRGSCKSFGSSVFTTTLKVADKVTEPVRSITDKLLSVKTLIAGMATGAAAKAFIGAPITLADNLSTASVGFETMLGSASKAQQMMGSIQKFAIATPFGTQDLVKDSQQMLAYGFNAKQIIPTLNAIGNAEAALGGGAEDIQRVIVALGQMKMKGKMSSAEMLQMTDNSINAWKYVAQSMGKTVPEIQKMAEKGLIPADKAVDAIVKGMGEFNGMMDKTANRTASGLISQIQDTFDIGIITKWGRGLQNGAIKGLTRFNKFLGDIDPILQKAGSSLEDFGSALSTKVFDVLGHIEDRMTKVFSSDRFKKADIGGKIHIAWDEVIAQPFSSWWESTGKKKIANKLSGIGESLGSGITGGITTILGFNDGDAKQQGINLGSSFISGFIKGFDMKKIGNAFQGFAEKHKALMVTMGLKLGANLMSGMATGIRNGRTLLDSVKGIFGKKSAGGGPGMSMPSASTVSSMNVLANVVNIAGKTFGGAPSVPASVPRSGSLPALPSGGNKPLLEAGEAAAGGSLLQKFGASKAGGLFGKVGTALGAGTATAGGTALVGAASSAGALTAGVAAVDAGKDFYDASKLSSGKAQKDKLFQGGTKLGMIGAGAGAGAAAGAGIGAAFGGVGAAPGALIGAGIGGVGALLGGDSAGKALSDSTDKGGALEKTWTSAKKTVQDAWAGFPGWFQSNVASPVQNTASSAGQWVGDKWGEAKSSVSNAWSGFSDWFGTNIWTPVSDNGISAINIAVGAWETAKEGISSAWNSFSGWWGNNVSTPVENAAATAGQWVQDKWTAAQQGASAAWNSFFGWWGNNVSSPVENAAATAGQWVQDKWSAAQQGASAAWSSFSGWWGSNVATPVEGAAATAGQWVQDRWSAAQQGASAAWSSFSGWWGSNVATPVEGAAATAGQWVQDRWTAAQQGASAAWSSFSGWWGNNVATPVENAASAAGQWVQDRWTEAKSSVQGAWSNVSSWFESNVWSPVKSAGASAMSWVQGRINDFQNMRAGLGDKGAKTTGLKTSTGQSTTVRKSKKAAGGLVSRPTTTLLGEEGTPEMVIPLSDRRRDRGVQLWQQAGSFLGQNVDAKANGGFGGQIIQFPSNVGDTPSPQPQRVSSGSVIGMDGGTKVVIQEIKIVVDGGKDGNVLQQIKDHKEEIANIVSDAIADGIEKNQNNTPLEECS